MKLIDVENVRLFVNGITRSLEAAQYNTENNNQHGIEVNIHNALVEMAALREELEKPDLILKIRRRRGSLEVGCKGTCVYCDDGTGEAVVGSGSLLVLDPDGEEPR
jgi:hypothetical protein